MTMKLASKDILARLEDLHRQATEERSHYYTGKCIQDAIIEIKALRAAMELARIKLGVK